jgi:hypothetical protein
VRVVVVPAKGSQVKFGEETWVAVTEAGDVERTLEQDIKIQVRNDCCEEYAQLVRPGVDSEVLVQLQQLPASVIAKCDAPGDITVRINNRAVKLGEPVQEAFAKNTTQTTKEFTVSFAGEHVSSTPKIVSVRAHETATVTCDPR